MPEPGSGRSEVVLDRVGSKLVSPNGFDGRGPVPEKVREAARRLAHLRVKFLTTDALTTSEVREVLDAAALQAEWMRELYEAVHGGEADAAE